MSKMINVMNSPLDQLNARIREVSDLRHAADLLEWDERVCMPSGGASTHGEMLSTVRKLAHEQFTATEVGRLLDAAARDVASADPDADSTRLVAVIARDYRKATQVPATFVAEQAEAVSAAQHAWTEARAKNDFALFRSHLERVIVLKRQYVSFFPPADHPYDVLLDDFEPGMKTAEVRAMLDELRKGQVELLRAIAARPQIDDACLHVPYAKADLHEFAMAVITKLGFDWERGRQDTSTHPFATAIGSNDVRIATRFMERAPFSLLFGAMHETGHALY
jgi:carboxypeptidase Taq